MIKYLSCTHHQESTPEIFIPTFAAIQAVHKNMIKDILRTWSEEPENTSKVTFHAYITKKATVSADQTIAKDLTKNGIMTLIKGIKRNK